MLPPPQAAPLENPAPLSLTDVEQIALQNNPSIARLAAQIEAQRGKWIQAGLYPNPVIGYQAMQIGDEGKAGQQGAYFSQQIVTAGKLKLDQQIAAQDMQRIFQQLEIQKLRVLSDVRTWFKNVLIAQNRLAVAGELVKVANIGEEATSKLNKAGQVGLDDVLQAQIEADSAHIILIKAQNQHREAWQRLTLVMGLPQLQPKLVAGSVDKNLPEFDWQQVFTSLLNTSPELAAAQTKVAKTQWAVKRAKVEVVPNIMVMASAQHDNGTGDNISGVQVGLPIPVFNRNQGNILAAKAESAAAQSEVRQLELELINRLAMEFRRYQDALVQVKTYQGRILSNARKTLDLLTQGYEKKQVNYLKVLVAQRTYFQVNLQYLDALQGLYESAAILESQMLSGSLQMPR